MERYFPDPYRFIPPYPSTRWCGLGRRLMLRHLRGAMRVVRWQFEGGELLRASLKRGAGVLLAPNHSRASDPIVVGELARQAGTWLYYAASYHLFKQGRLRAWLMNRMGGYSLWREGSDRESLRASAALLAAADRPVVLFPEGTWFRRNDTVGPLQEGLSLITRQAARQTDRPLLVHPVGLKYWVLDDPRPELTRRLATLERRLGWRPQDGLGLVERIEKVGGALLGIKEAEQFGRAQPGTLDERLRGLLEFRLAAHEKEFFGAAFSGPALGRIRRVRQVLVRRLAEAAGRGAAEVAHVREALADLLFCEHLHAHSFEYLCERPSLERLSEAVERLEETLTDDARPPAPLGVTAAVGPALDARAFTARVGGGSDSLTEVLRGAVQALLEGLLAQGPPPAWGCPPRVE